MTITKNVDVYKRQVPSVHKKMKGQMNQYIIGPYQKVVEQAKAKQE